MTIVKININDGKETEAQRAERIRESENGRKMRSRMIPNKKKEMKNRYNKLEEQ